MQRTIIQMLHDAAQRFPQRAYTNTRTDEGWIPSSFSETDLHSDWIAAHFIDADYKAQQAVAILSEGKGEWVTFEHGVIKARLISVPLSIKLTTEEIAFRVNHSEAVAIAVSANTFSNVLKAASHFERKVLFICLDAMNERLEMKINEEGWKEGVDYLLFSQMLSNGKAVLEKKPTLIKDLEKKIREDDVINICYTSGTTGNPKGIMLTHANYWTNAHDGLDLFKIPEATFETLVVLPVDHSFAHTVGTYIALLVGITLHFVDSRGSNAAIIRNFPKNLVELNPTFMMTVPSITGNFMKKMIQGVAQKGKFIEGIFNRGLEAGIKRNGDGFNKPSTLTMVKTWFPYTLANLLVFGKLRKVFGSEILYCVGGGALLETRQQHFFAAIGIPVYQGYGLTEAAPIISSNNPHRYKFGTSGVVTKSQVCKIMVDEKTEAEVGQRGEIVIKGENVMKGYFKNPEATAEAIRDGWLWTGDLGYYDEDGFLVVTGRAKALLIAKDGEKYSPEEIEEVIVSHVPIINQLMVHNDHQVLTCALVTLNESETERLLQDRVAKTPEEAYKVIISALTSYEQHAEGIPPHWLPSRFALIAKPFSEEDGLINSTMKLVRYKTAEFYKERIAKLYESEEENDKRNIKAIKELFFSS